MRNRPSLATLVYAGIVLFTIEASLVGIVDGLALGNLALMAVSAIGFAGALMIAWEL